MEDPKTQRYIGYLILLMILTVLYALSPSKEVRVRVADERFQHFENGDLSGDKYTLSLALEEGTTYHIEETTRHTATTRRARSFLKNTYEVLAQTEYNTHVALDLTVIEVTKDEIVCQATLKDFMGYEEVDSDPSVVHKGKFNDGDDEDDEERKNRSKEMYSKVREATKGVEFQVVLGSDGTVKEMQTSNLRKAIITGLHEAGQLPMHLEHAVLVGGYDVYPANGASFGPLGRTNVRGPVMRMKGTGCTEPKPQDLYKGRILVVNRGDCTFETKAKIASQFDAVALIVVDLEMNEGAVMTYMSGEGDSDIVSVIVNKEAGKAIEEEMKNMVDFSEDSKGNMFASGNYLVEILGGVEAVQALNEEDFEDGEEDGQGLKQKKKMKSHHLNPYHSDGLHDFVGIGYVVDEVIRTRFSIFPSVPVNIGSSWVRTLYLSDGIDPTLQAKIVEKYTLTSVFRAEEDFEIGKKGDLIAEIRYNAKESPEKRGTEQNEGDVKQIIPVTPSIQDQIEEQVNEQEQNRITPQFTRPALKGHEFQTSGILRVHIPTGFVLSGESSSTSSSERLVVMENKRTGKKKTMRAKVDLKARTHYSGLFE